MKTNSTNPAPIVAVAVVVRLLSFAAGYAVGRLGQAAADTPATATTATTPSTTEQPEDMDRATAFDTAGDEPAEMLESEAETETLENYRALVAENESLREEIRLKDRLIEALEMKIDELTEAAENPTL